MDEPLPPNKKAPHLSEDEVTLYLIASSLTLLAQEIDNGTPLTLPYPASLQHGLNRLTVACLRQGQTPPQSLPHLFTWCHTPLADWPLQLPADAISSNRASSALRKTGRSASDPIGFFEEGVTDEQTRHSTFV